jgi:DNA polymerase III alpha subunit
MCLTDAGNTLARSRHGYGQLCRLITRARRAAVKGSFALERAWLEGARWLFGDLAAPSKNRRD